MKKKHIDIALSTVAALLILSMGAGIWLIPSKDFSHEENRPLATLSPPTVRSIADGSFSEELCAFLSDRLPLRLLFIRLRACSELLLMKGESNGVIIGRDGYLIDRGEYADLNKARKNVEDISSLCAYFTEAGVPVTVAYVPRIIDVMESKLPLFYSGDHKEILSIIPPSRSAVDLLSPLRSAADRGEHVWFKTDHHWTADGAYVAYTELSEALGYIPYEKDLFKAETVSESFLGSIYSRAGCIAPSPDNIVLYRYEGDGEYMLSIDGKAPRKGLYFTEYLEKKDKYAIFLGGNYARVSIEKMTDVPRPRLVLIKDSYANSLVPFLALHFDIEMIDPRFFSEYEEIHSQISNCDRVLILQGLDTIAT